MPSPWRDPLGAVGLASIGPGSIGKTLGQALVLLALLAAACASSDTPAPDVATPWPAAGTAVPVPETAPALSPFPWPASPTSDATPAPPTGKPETPPALTQSPEPTGNAARPAAPGPLPQVDVERAFPDLEFRRLTNLAQPDDGRGMLFVTEQAGLVRLFPNRQDAAEAGVFLDIRDRVREVNNEEGLLGLAFDPGYAGNGFFYVHYSAGSPRRSVVSRFSVSPGDPLRADPGSELVVMEIRQPFGNHNGGQIAFGPDGYLYVALGDGGSAGDPGDNGQDLETLLGSVLRIDVSQSSPGEPYRIPHDNPFVGEPGVRWEIWAYGLRNPWRFSFDASGRLWAADVGQNAWEEIGVLEGGGNYGWRCMEGLHRFRWESGCDSAVLTSPVWEYPRTSGNCSVTGGYVYRGSGIPDLAGAYVYGDYCSGRIWGLRLDGGSVGEQALLAESGLFIASFGEDLDGNLYVLSRNEGIYRLTERR